MSLNLNKTELRISAGNEKQFPRDPIPQIAFSGRSNVGKSSLINSLLMRNSLARVSSKPGKTITINFYEVDKKMFLVDLPGYGFAARDPHNREEWSKLTDGYFTRNPNLDLLKAVVQLIDSRAGITADDRMMLRFLNSANIPYIVVITKIDKLNKTEREARENAVLEDEDVAGGTPILSYSTTANEGRPELWSLIGKYTGIS